jgi:hypothetical protein
VVRPSYISVTEIRFKRQREDSVPTDTGCEVAPLCLECPLPKCRYDMTQKERVYHGIVGAGRPVSAKSRKKGKEL